MVNSKRRFHLDCDCGQDCLVIDYWPEDNYDGGGQLIIMSYMTTYPTTDSLWKRLGACWHILKGKEYTLWDIIIRENKLKALKEFIDKCVVG